ncbi:MAG: hypothetical protein Q9174_006025, partial [Haloplaca sp. 1 TL-2023]
MPHPLASKILFVDAYDSFSNNIISLLETRLPSVHVTSIKIDEPIADFPTFLSKFDAVVAGPGPGHPSNPQDVGLMSRLWQLVDDDMIPVLGICLGFQSLVTAFGGQVVPLPKPQHGVVRKVVSSGTSIFRGIPKLAPVQYHSLHALLPGYSDVAVHSPLAGGLGPCNIDHDLEALAWDVGGGDRNATLPKTSHASSGAVLMASKHRTKPFYGLQFHPESICSDEGSRQLIVNWWSEAQQWNQQHRATGLRYRRIRNRPRSPSTTSKAHLPSFTSHDQAVNGYGSELRTQPKLYGAPKKPLKVISHVIPLGTLTVNDICDLLNTRSGHGVVLDSERHQRPEVGRFSIIGKIHPTSIRLEYSVGSGSVKIFGNGTASGYDPLDVRLESFQNDIFCYLKAFMEPRTAVGGDPSIPFWGGLVGNISYEACLETIGIQTPRHEGKPDINFLYVERSVVIDHELQTVHIQSIIPHDYDWRVQVSSELENLQRTCPEVYSCEPHVFQPGAVVSKIDPVEYGSKVRMCQEHIRKGNSYELCLTTQATSETRSQVEDTWPMYQRLRNLNPAPFSTYLRTGKLTLLSSSPERFMSWTRPSTYATTLIGETRSVVQFRPIKGTVKRYPHGPNGPEVSLQDAIRLLSTPKERAENLMIVDLIRHDLHGVVGSGN